MSRMVRESEVNGLRERLFFARTLLNTLNSDPAGAIGHRLALRGAVLFHLYSVLVGLARQAAKNYQVAGYQDLIGLAALENAFRAAGVASPELRLIAQARADHADPVYWLDQEIRAAVGAAGLAQRPMAPQEHAGLAVRAEDPYAPLASGDLERLEQASRRVEGLVEECGRHTEEW